MDTETQAVHELFEITYETTKYTYRFISALFKHGSHGAAALAGLIRATLNGSGKKSGLANMKAVMKQSKDITGFTLDRNDFEVFQHQAKEMNLLYAAIAAETNPDMLTIITGSDQAALVNQIINVNNLNGVMMGTLEQAEPPVITEAPEQTGAEQTRQNSNTPHNDSATEAGPTNPQAAAESADFFSAFDEPEQNESVVTAAGEMEQSESSDNFFAAFSGEPEQETVYHQEPEIISVSEAELKEQPEEVLQAMREAGYLRQTEPDPMLPAQREESLSGNVLQNISETPGTPTADDRISVRGRVAEIKKSGKPKDAPITLKVRDLVKDKKGVSL